MGNQLAGIAPSQILSVDHYLTDVTDYEYDTNLGSTRFMKVARAKYREGLAVVKVFAIHDPSLPLIGFKNQLEQIKIKLRDAPNCLPYMRSTLSEKAALLFRQYLRDNIYDRISTRPFLNTTEKKWIAFQLLCALDQAHQAQVCHGDIKSENVMVTGWNWLLLTDFASFKPTYLPDNDPADFNYFFDTSRRRSCYIAPERFVDVTSKTGESEMSKMAAEESLPNRENIKTGKLTPAMDIFSAGCVITELFTEGQTPFHLSDLLAYRSGMYQPDEVINKIEDPDIKTLVSHMMQKDPSRRFSAREYLEQWKAKAFPEYFYSFLKDYVAGFVGTPILPSDEKIARVHRDMEKILEALCLPQLNSKMSADSTTDSNGSDGLVIVVSLVTSCVRTLKFCLSKLTALDILLKLARHTTSEIILDRLVPNMLNMVNDSFPRVRAAAIKTLSETLTLVQVIPKSDANIFPEYILPGLARLTNDGVVLVRVAYAENIAVLAETALRYLEITQLDHNSGGHKDQHGDHHGDELLDSNMEYSVSYDVELRDLHQMVQQKVVTLLSDPENIVKQTLLEKGITRLCVFFGRQKASDVLLSHMITFLNDKNDWQLRWSFFDSIAGVAAYIGWQSSTILKPLLQQGLSDQEEFVIGKTLHALTDLVELGLLQKLTLQEMAAEVMPFLIHPNVWLRQGTVGFIAAVARSLNVVEIYCKLLPLLQNYIQKPIVQVDKEVVLLSVLNEAVPRSVYDYVLKPSTVSVETLFKTLHGRQLTRNLQRTGHEPQYQQIDDSKLDVYFRKLASHGMTEKQEDNLLLLKDIITKISHSPSEPSNSDSQKQASLQGVVNLEVIDIVPGWRKMAELTTSTSEGANQQQGRKSSSSKKKQSIASEPIMNEEWKSMFGSVDMSNKSAPPTSKQQQQQQSQSSDGGGKEASGGTELSPDLPISMSQLQLQESGEKKQPATKQSQQPEVKQLSIQAKYASCKLNLRRLVQKKREQYVAYMSTSTVMEEALYESKASPSGWRPKGILVAHLHEHRGAVNRICVSDDHSMFVTCSNDGTVKIWDCRRLEGKSVSNRSRGSYNKQGGPIKAVTFCQNSHSVASASEDGSIHVYRVDPNAPKISLIHTKRLDLNEEGAVVDMIHFDTGSQSLLLYGTVLGHLVGWDLRMPGTAWKLKNDPKHGLMTSIAVDHRQSWLAVGTTSGVHVCWDMRFQLPITVLVHPSASRIRKLLLHPSKMSRVISAVQGNNEVSIWDMETGNRDTTLWASQAPPLSLQTQTSGHSVNGMHCTMVDGNPVLLTAGSDQRIRFWDLTSPLNSYIVAGSASDQASMKTVSYSDKVIEGTHVIQENYTKHRSVNGEEGEGPRRGPDPVPAGHRDIITDLAVFQTLQGFVVTGSQDGVVKIWK